MSAFPKEKEDDAEPMLTPTPSPPREPEVHAITYGER